MSRKHLEVNINGRVQGVGFRYRIKEYAEEHGVTGYARNLQNKSVTIELEGEEKVLNELIQWLKSSPGLSNIKELELVESEIKGFRDFKIY